MNLPNYAKDLDEAVSFRKALEFSVE